VDRVVDLMGLDLNRGVLQRPVKDAAGNPSGAWIAMYTGVPADGFKGAEPGVYYDDAGNEVTEAEAAAAGFDVKLHAAEKRSKDRRAQFEREEAVRRDEEERALQDEIELDVSGRTDAVLEQAKVAGMELRHMGGRYWNVFHAGAKQAIAERHMLKPEALALLERELSERKSATA
jgi:hypothetical protein